MKKAFTLLFFISLFYTHTNLQAQVEIAPNFTATDIEGNTWTLYDVLDQGKSVIMDVSATWCGPCWSFHQTKTLENLYEQYGPNGTDELVVLFVEGDENTTLADLQGTGDNTLGDWVAGTTYPIIDDGSITDLYDVTGFPTIFHICPSRLVTDIERVSIEEYIGAHRGCPQAAGANNAGIISYDGFQGAFCREIAFEPTFKFQNLGSETITSASVELKINGNSVQTIDWDGSINTFQISDIAFDQVSLTENSQLDFDILSVNGVADDNADNNSLQVGTQLSETSESAYITLELTTDSFPAETYWELLDENGTALYTGGNPGIFTGSLAEGAYTSIVTTYTHQIPLPTSGCYDFVLYDFYSDGICCTYGEGGYVIKNEAGDILGTGGAFETASETIPFNLDGTPSIDNNATIISYQGLTGSFCQELDYQPTVVLQNVGAMPMTSAKITMKDESGTELQVFDWTGDVATGSIAAVALDPVVIDQTNTYTFEITEINGAEDAFDFKNSYDITIERAVESEYRDLSLEIRTDRYGYELYWQIEDENGEAIASGGNTNVGPDGAGNRVATGSDPGAYASSSTITETIQVPANGCYSLLVVDDYADGLELGSYVRLNDVESNTLIEVVGGFAELEPPFEVNELVNSLPTVEGLSSIQLQPNPASEMTTLQFSLDQSRELDIHLTNALGQKISLAQGRSFPAGDNQLDIPLGDLADGLYFVSLQDGQQLSTQRLIINR
ncbi:MAG: T9SS type A sorting domain-containing protein [Bacteroidota bacterium]